jgi:hypothetical protein
MDPTELKPSDFNPYYSKYIDSVGNLPLITALEKGWKSTHTFFENLPADKWNYRYAENKWTPKDILQHLSDTERVFAYRALYFVRFRNADLKGFDENVFADNAMANNKSSEDLLRENTSVRLATISLFKNFTNEQFKQFGVANGNRMSVAAAGFVICGHEIHHCNIIKERYL